MGELLSKRAADAVEKLVRDSRRNPPPADKQLPAAAGWRPPIVAILLQDLNSEGKADCAIIAKVTTPQIQKVELVGSPGIFLGGRPHFTLSFKGQKTPALDYQISAADLQAKLEALSTIGKGNVTVRLGTLAPGTATPTSPGEAPGVWLVEFVGTFLDSTATIPLLVAGDLGGGVGAWIVVNATSVWIDTGAVETMNAVLPVGSPTPMRSGAVAVGLFFPGLGYGCISCEAREFTSNYTYYY